MPRCARPHPSRPRSARCTGAGPGAAAAAARVRPGRPGRRPGRARRPGPGLPRAPARRAACRRAAPPARPPAARPPARLSAGRLPAPGVRARRGAGSCAADRLAGASRAGTGLLHDRVLLHLHLHVEQAADRLFLDRLHHGVEQVVALALVLDQRIALGHGPQPDALAQVVHLVQVLAPLAVQHRQHDPPFQVAHQLGAQLLGPPVVGGLHVLLHDLGDQVAGQPGPLAACLLDHLVAA